MSVENRADAGNAVALTAADLLRAALEELGPGITPDQLTDLLQKSIAELNRALAAEPFVTRHEFTGGVLGGLLLDVYRGWLRHHRVAYPDGSGPRSN